MHIAHSRHTKAQRLFDTQDVASQGVNMRVDETWHQSARWFREDGLLESSTSSERSYSELLDGTILDFDISFLDKDVPGEDTDVLEDK